MFSVTPFESRTLSWWYAKRAQIDLAPPYQRRSGIWSAEDKAFLIDSIINELDIPKLYVADFTFTPSPLNRAQLPFAIIDGKQRLEAIFDFIEGRLQLSRRFEYLKDPAVNLSGLAYKDLKQNHSEVACQFDNFNLSVMRVVTDDEAVINEMFLRLNRSKSLRGAEIRNAMHGVVPKAIRELAQHPFFKECIGFSTVRGEDQNAAAKLLICEFRGALVQTKKDVLDKFVEDFVNSEQPDIHRALARARDVLARMAAVFAKKDPLLRSSGVLPVYYWLIRSIPERSQCVLREFLLWFNREVSIAREQVDARDGSVDAELVAYISLSRSTNDQASYVGRLRILLARLRSYASETLAGARPA